MSAYNRFVRAWLYIMAAGFSFGSLGLYVSPWFFVLFFAIVFIIPRALDGINCPNCGTPVTYQGSLGGYKINGGFIHRYCRNCGWDLKKNK